MKCPSLEAALALAYRRWEEAPRALQREAIARAGLALVEQFERLPPEVMAIRELFERSIPPRVRAHRQLVRILRAHSFKPVAVEMLGPEWPSPADPRRASAHVMLTGFLLGQRFLRFSPQVTQQLKSLMACFMVAQDKALESQP